MLPIVGNSVPNVLWLSQYLIGAFSREPIALIVHAT